MFDQYLVISLISFDIDDWYWFVIDDPIRVWQTAFIPSTPISVRKVSIFSSSLHLEILFCENCDCKEGIFFILMDKITDMQGMSVAKETAQNLDIKTM